MVKVKICGITNEDDAENALEAGADALGFVFYPPSPRYVAPETAARIVARVGPFAVAVGVFVDEPADVVNRIAREVGLDRVQLHGDEPSGYCSEITAPVIKAFRVRSRDVLRVIPTYGVGAFLLDAYSASEYGGTGNHFDWDIAREATGLGKMILSGGLTPENVREAVSRVRPYAVDVSSGVSPANDKRRKDVSKMRQFVEAARAGWEAGA